ncbi:MAG: mechanosensitive ion channel domain-containing protein [Haloarculaceae archaeon]|jgi:small-conductance mechanosensitive channel
MRVLQVEAVVERLLRELAGMELTVAFAVLILLSGFVVGVAVARWLGRLLVRLDVPTAVEGTPFERTARSFGTSTVALLSRLAGLFVFLVAFVVALRLLGVLATELFVARLADFFPNLFVAALIVILGLLVGDKAHVMVSERLSSVKLPEVTLIPSLVKYSIFYVAGLLALAQLGVATAALLVLLAAYAFGLFFVGGLACKDMLTSAAAGIYLLLTEPYTIGDEVRIDDQRGIVQEMDVFVTRIESDEEEYLVPNRLVFRRGIVRVRS